MTAHRFASTLNAELDRISSQVTTTELALIEKSLRHTFGVALHNPLVRLSELAQHDDLAQAQAVIGALLD